MGALIYSLAIAMSAACTAVPSRGADSSPAVRTAGSDGPAAVSESGASRPEAAPPAAYTPAAGTGAPAAGSSARRLSQTTAAFQADAPAGRARPPREYRLDEFSVILSRGPCDGDCPVYTVGIHGSGLVAYYGESNVATAGQEIGTIPPEKVVKLIEDVYAADFTGLRDRYLSRLVPKVTDGGTVIPTYVGTTGSPRTVITLTIRDFEKRVVFQPEYAPPELVKLADFIDEVSGSRNRTGR